MEKTAKNVPEFVAGFFCKKDKLKNGGIQRNACLEWNGKVDQIYLKFGLKSLICSINEANQFLKSMRI